MAAAAPIAIGRLDELTRRLRARLTTTNHPPAPVMAMLGEIVVHSQDIGRPLGMTHQISPEALIAVADHWKAANLLIGAKRRIGGLKLRATDVDCLPLLVDASPPAVFAAMATGWVPTIELTVHVRAVPQPGWLRAAIATFAARRGFPPT